MNMGNTILVLSLCLFQLWTAGNALPVEEKSTFCREKLLSASRAVNQINADIQRRIDGPENTFFSPLGLSMALGMAYLGAAGRTASQMEHALGYAKAGLQKEQVHQSMRELSEYYLKRSNDAYSLDLANGVFSQIGLEVPELYSNGLKTYYDGESKSVDFKNNAEEATNTINSWAEEKTHGKVKDFFGEPLPTDTVVVLTNAIYFKGTWKVQFPENLTYTSGFYVNGENVGNVEMMSLTTEILPFYKDTENGYKYVELPYKGEDVSMILALPLDYKKTPDQVLSTDTLCHITENLKPRKLQNVEIPKFKLEYQRSMKQPLIELGMTDAFNGRADFTGLHEHVQISDVLQKAVIEVNEQGSEAAAVTGVVIENRSGFIGDEFVANRPFAFTIIHKKSGVILFSGKVLSL